MKVQNVSRVMIAKGIELERDIKPGEMTVVVPGFEQTTRVLAMLQTGSVVVVAEGFKTESGATVMVHPESANPLDGWGQDLPLPKLASQIQKIQEEQDLAEQPEEMSETLEHTGEAHIITPTLLSEDQKTNVLADTPLPPKVDPIDELMVFLSKKGAARRRFVEEMTDLKALRAALAASKRHGSVREALCARIEKLSHVSDKYDS